MKFLQHLDCSPYLHYECLRDKDHKITGIQITEVSLSDLTDYLFTLVDPKNNLQDPMIKMNFEILDPDHQQSLTDEMLITRYAIHRILTYFKLYSNDPWTFYLDRDYYGEDVEMVYLKLPLAESIDKYLANLVNKKAHERIESVLKLEYGYLIPSVMNKNWRVTTVHPDELYYSNQKHYQQCLADLEDPQETDTNRSISSLVQSVVEAMTNSDNSTESPVNQENHLSIPTTTESSCQSPTLPQLPTQQQVSVNISTEATPDSTTTKPALSPLQKLRLTQYRRQLTELTLPRAITIRNPNGQYKVIDGYHRLAGCPTDQGPLIIYCEREELKKFRQK